MASQTLVSLFCLVTSFLQTQGTFPMIGGLGSPFMGKPFMGNPFMQGLNTKQNKQQVDPNLLTCISADSQDIQSQIRLTLQPMNTANGPMGQLGPLGSLGFGSMGALGHNPNRPQDWSINGMMLPSQVVQKAGSYQMAIFKGGRTFGECKGAALGEVLESRPLGPMGLGLPPFSPLSLGLNPLASMMGMRTQQQKAGVLRNPLLLSAGPSVYSGMIQGVSLNQLVGGSIAACEVIHNDRCMGTIPYCCPITRDMLPASQEFVDAVVPGPTVSAFSPFGAQQGALVGAGPVAGGLPIGQVGQIGLVGGANIVNIGEDENNGIF